MFRRITRVRRRVRRRGEGRGRAIRRRKREGGEGIGMSIGKYSPMSEMLYEVMCSEIINYMYIKRFCKVQNNPI